MNKLKFYILIIIIFLCQYKLNAQKTDSIHSYLKQFKNELNLSSISVAIVGIDGILYKTALGKRPIGENCELNTQHIYPLGSISKLFTASAFMTLADEKKIDLDEDVANYLPFKFKNIKFPSSPVTFRMLLTHTSGIADRQKLQDELYGHGDPKIPLSTIVKDFFKADGKYFSNENYLDFKPGSSYEYSNWNYVLLAYLIEQISQQDYQEYSKKVLLNPLNMNHSAWYLANLDREQLGQLYVPTDSIYKKAIDSEYSWPGYPDGSLRSNVEELSHFIQMILNHGFYNGKQIMDTNSINRMLTPQNIQNMPPSYIYDMGLGWHVGKVPDRVFIHSGSPSGSSMYLLVNPEKKYGFISFITGINMSDSKTERAWINHLKFLIQSSEEYIRYQK